MSISKFDGRAVVSASANGQGGVLTRADGSPLRVLVVDDEVSLTELLRMALRYEGWDVRTASAGQQALFVAREFAPDVVMLPDIDGLQVLSRMRADGSDVPVLFLTAKDALDDRIAGLTAGGDDYVTKPFSLEEVVARLRGLIRRSGHAAAPSTGPVIVVGDLELNEDTHEVHRGGRQIELSPTEFKLLRYLLLNPNRVLSKSQILDHVWQYDWAGDANIVESYISYLRRKIDAPSPDGSAPVPLIQTKRGVGYMLRQP